MAQGTLVALLVEQGLECREQGVGDDFGAYCSGVNAVLLDGSGDIDKIDVNHGNDCGVMFGCHRGKDRVKLADVIGTKVRRKGDTGEQDFDVRALECGEDSIKIIPGQIERKSPEAIVAAKLDDHDGGMHADDGPDTGQGILGGGSAGPLVGDYVVIAKLVEVSL